MPTYDYHCKKCGQDFEAVQSMKDDHFKTCPEALCKNAGGWEHGEVTRLMGTGAGLIFKGSGFYITDYRSQNYKDGAKKDAPAAPAKSEGGSGGGDAKPATPAAPAKTDGGSGKTSSSGGGSSSSSPAAS